jgi:Spy/CpxP family protein refolding chaperone
MTRNTKIAIAVALLALVAVGALAGATVAFAQRGVPPTGSGPWSMMGGWGGHMGGRGMMGGGGGPAMMAGIVDRDAMHAAIAEALGMSVEDFEAALAEGETPYTLAEARNIEFATVTAAMTETLSAALDEAVAAGRLTREQADWMLSRHTTMMANWGQNGGPGWGMGNHGNCPYHPTPTPAP